MTASPVRSTTLNASPTHDAGKRDDVGQQVMFEVDREQHDQRAAEDEPRREQDGWAVVPPAAPNITAVIASMIG